jgi:hypothetical protein
MRTRDIERKRARRCIETPMPALSSFATRCKVCGEFVLPVYCEDGVKRTLDFVPSADGSYSIDEPQKRYVITPNRPTRTAWELFAREAMGESAPRYKLHKHNPQNKPAPVASRLYLHTTVPGVSARRVAVQLLLFPPNWK